MTKYPRDAVGTYTDDVCMDCWAGEPCRDLRLKGLFGEDTDMAFALSTDAVKVPIFFQSIPPPVCEQALMIPAGVQEPHVFPRVSSPADVHEATPGGTLQEAHHPRRGVCSRPFQPR